MSTNYPLFVKRDLDGFFGLFVDNLVQLLLIVALCGTCGMTGPKDSKLLFEIILPGAAVSILAGNLFYAWQAHQLAKRTGRNDVTALPYGINTPSLLVYIFFVMQPVYNQTKSAQAAWEMGLLACLGSGVIEFGGAFVAEWIRRRTPRAALLSTLAGIAIGFISMTFALQIFDKPLIAMLPLGVVLVTYFSRVAFPLGLPGGLLAVALGTICAWILPDSLTGAGMSSAKVQSALQQTGWYLPQFVGGTLWKVLQQPDEWVRYLAVIVPMGLFNLIGSLQNIESAEASGDRFDTRASLAANGIGTILAACFGSCFPTTIYIGHPGWKEMGARAGYSTLNGLVITAICLTGTVALIDAVVPRQAGMAIVLWIGIIITAQAFMATPAPHAPAVAVGLFPAIAAWGQTVMQGAFLSAGPQARTMQQLLTENIATEVNGFLLHGLLLMERGYILTCMILAAVSAVLVDRKFFAAGVWCLVGAACAGIGLTHAYQVVGSIVDYLFVFQTPHDGWLAYRGTGIAGGYALMAALFCLCGVMQQRGLLKDGSGH